MGRRKTYDRDEIAERAMHLFWERGYHATSTRELTEAMGVNPYSLYAEFGSKEGLYQAAIERYEDQIVTKHFGKLEDVDGSLSEIRYVLNFFGDSGLRSGSELGCLLCNAATEQAPNAEMSEASTARFVTRLTLAFSNALNNAKRAGRLIEGVEVGPISQLFTTLVMGIFAMSRARVDGLVMRGAADQALERLHQITRPCAL